jgi:hypothetical protein
MEPDAAAGVQLPIGQKADWSGLWVRTQRSCVMTLDITRILVLDAVLLAIGYLIIRLTALIADGDAFFLVAHKLSHGLFLLLYVILAGFDIVELFKGRR